MEILSEKGSRLIGPIGMMRFWLALAFVSFVAALVLALADAARPGQRLGFVLAGGIFLVAGWLTKRKVERHE